MSSLREYNTLKQTKEFSYIYNNAKKFHTNSILVFYKKSTQKKVGFTASKKVGNAVERNFSKRRMRALFLEFHERIEDGIFVFVAKNEILEVEYKELQKNIHYALKRVGALKKS